MAFSITWTLCSRTSEVIPVPQPVTSRGGRPVITAVIAADGVVLPIPMSPQASRSRPRSISSWTTRAPSSKAATACSRVIAGPTVKSAVPQAIFPWTNPSVGVL